MCIDANIRARSGARHVTRVCKEARGAPKKFLAACSHVLLKVFRDAVKHGVRLTQRSKLRRNIPVVETEAVYPALL